MDELIPLILIIAKMAIHNLMKPTKLGRMLLMSYAISNFVMLFRKYSHVIMTIKLITSIDNTIS